MRLIEETKGTVAVKAHRSRLCEGIFEIIQILELDITEAFRSFLAIPDNLDRFCLKKRSVSGSH